MRTFIVWVVYGYVNGKYGQEVKEFAYREEQEARDLATTLRDGYVTREKRAKN